MRAYVQSVLMLKDVMMIVHPRKKRYRIDIVYFLVIRMMNNNLREWNLNLAAMALDNLPRDREAEPEPDIAGREERLRCAPPLRPPRNRAPL